MQEKALIFGLGMILGYVVCLYTTRNNGKPAYIQGK